MIITTVAKVFMVIINFSLRLCLRKLLTNKEKPAITNKINPHAVKRKDLFYLLQVTIFFRALDQLRREPYQPRLWCTCQSS